METILIADANVKSREILVNLLAEKYHIVCVDTGRQAVDVLNNTSVVCLIMDFYIPVLNGFDVISFMKNRNIFDNIPVIIICSQNNPEYIKKGYEAGISDKIHRPFDNAIIKKRIDNVIKLYRQKRILVENRHKMEDELGRAKEALDAKGRFINSMSHDIRTPMLTINGMAELAKSNLDDKVKVKGCIDRLSAAADHLLKLINDILDMSRIENNKLKMHSEKCSISEIVQAVNLIVWPQFREKEISFDIETEIYHENVIADSTRLRQLLINLLGDSMFICSKKSSIIMEITEEKSLRTGYVCYRFRIIKDGAKQLRKLLYVNNNNYEFMRESLSFNITKTLVELMHGSVTFNEVGGNRIEIDVRVMLQVDERKEELINTEKRILVTDNNRSLCKSIVNYIEKLGIEAEYVTTSAEALDRVRDNVKNNTPYDIIFTGCRLKETDSEEFVSKLRKISQDDLKIIGISYYDVEEYIDNKDVLYDKKLIKPVFMSGLIECINEVYEKEEDSLAKTSVKTFPGKTILVVDDNAVNRMIAGDMLEDIEVKMVEAAGGKEAVDIMSGANPGDIDMILMDIQMPEMDGYEASRLIRNLDNEAVKGIPIVAMSAETYNGERFIEAEMNYYLSKPANFDELLRTLEQIFEG